MHMDMSTASDVMCPHDARLLNRFSTNLYLYLQSSAPGPCNISFAREINGQCMDVLSGGGGGCCGPMVWDLSHLCHSGVAAMLVFPFGHARHGKLLR